MDERVVRLLDVHLTFAFVWGHCASLHGHFASAELHQVLTGGAARPRHHAGEESSRRHNEDLLGDQTQSNTGNTGSGSHFTLSSGPGYAIIGPHITIANIVVFYILLNLHIKMRFRQSETSDVTDLENDHLYRLLLKIG